MRIVVALGGNALAKRGEPMTAEKLRENIHSSAEALADLAREHELVITHGNGPQVGLIALQNLAYEDVPPYPLDILGAQSQGMIAYPLQQELKNTLRGAKDVVTIITTTEVNADDPDFDNPSKFVGPMYTKEEAEENASHYGWTIKADGDGFRRVVPSPVPTAIVEALIIKDLVESNRVVICVGGGGVPITVGDGQEKGIEAVVDKDLASAVLAEELDADVLLILTDADYVVEGWGSVDAKNIRAASPEALEDMAFAAGSMGPKIDAAMMVARAGGRTLIGPLSRVKDVVAGKVGTEIREEVPGGIEYAD